METDSRSTADSEAPGWAAIDASLARLYGDQQPRHMGTILSYRLGGPDPLDGISVYRRTQPVPHWHYVTYGFSELYGKDSEDAATSGYGFELSFRLRAGEDESSPPTWVFSFLQNLARYVFGTGNVLSPGDWMTANGPIALETATEICSMGFVGDPELPAVATPHGRLAFVQVVGLTREEELAAKRWQTTNLLYVLLPHMPLWVTDLRRTSLLGIPDVAEQVRAGTERDGSSNGYLYTDVLAVEEQTRLLRAPLVKIDIGAKQTQELGALLPLRIPFGRPLILAGRDWQLRFEAGKRPAASIEGNVITVTLDASAAQSFARSVLPREGRYQLPALPGVAWRVRPTLIRDADGEVAERIG